MKTSHFRIPALALSFLFLSMFANAQYCVPQYADACDFGDNIQDFTLAGIGASTINDLGTGCGSNGYDDRTTTVAPVDMMQGSAYSGTITTDGSSEFYQIWIDADNNNVFDAAEAMTPILGPVFNLTPGNFTLTVPLAATPGIHTMRVRMVNGFNPTMDPCTFYFAGETHDYLVNVTAAPACNGTPVLTGVTPAGPINTCGGATQTLVLGLPAAGGLNFQWQISTNGGTTWTDISGANSTYYTFAVTGSADYQVVVTCTGSGLSATSNVVSVVAPTTVYAPVPFFEDFETWGNNCSTTDIPLAGTANNWSNDPSTGNNSWRRDDQGFSANWTDFSGFYVPQSVSGSHSARFQSAGAQPGIPGNLDVYLDCSTITGNTELYFYMIDKVPFTWTQPSDDNLTVLLSTNGGGSFTQIGSWDSATVWTRQHVPINSSSAQTIVRFQGNQINYDGSDIGIDSVYFAPPCAGQPVAGNVSPGGSIAGCTGHSYVLNTIGTTMGGNLSYQWQESLDGINWSNSVSPGSNGVPFTTPSLFDTTYYRVIVTCGGSALADTSDVVELNIQPPQYANVPYFQDFENWSSYCDNNDIPSGAAVNWTNNPSTGDNSWRRDDDGASAGWTGGWGMYSPASLSGTHSARFQTAGSQNGIPGNLDLYLDCSTVPGDKALYFYMINPMNFQLGDSLSVFLSTDGGSSFNLLGGYDSANVWTHKRLPLISNASQTVIRFQANNYNFDGSDIGLDSVYVAPPCSGGAVAGNIVPGPVVSGCPGLTFGLTTVGTTLAGNLSYQWEESADGISWSNATGGSGSNTYFFTTPQLYDTIYYRLNVTCLGSGLSDVTAPVVLNIAAPVYASLPYSQGFESWMSYCTVQDVPGENWLNRPTSGDVSWRRDDEGSTANWNFPPGGSYSPVSMQGLHSARIHTWSASNFGDEGDLDLFVDCSDPGNKELQFYQINPSGSDELQVLLSTDGGANFNQIASWNTAANWTLRTAPVTSTSAQTVIRFRGVSDFSDDIGIDNVLVLLPCAGAPVAGTVDSLTPCSGVDFNLGLTGATLAAGMTYQWQESSDGVNWTNASGGNISILHGNITANTWYRCIITCTASGISDTTAPRLINLATFYYCYCSSAAQEDFDLDIGNVTIENFPAGTPVLNNGTASPLTFNTTAFNQYTDFTGLAPADLYKEQAYNMKVTQINNDNFFGGGGVAVYIDYDHSGSFDLSEQVLFGFPTQPTQQLADSFIVPANAKVGITGMRVVLTDGPFTFPAPCAQSFTGETEDYLVNINYPPCTGALNTGLVHLNNDLVCPGDPLIMIDTTHEYKQSGITWSWESSTDGVSWSAVASTTDQDTLLAPAPNVNTQYRLKMLCTLTNTASYSNVVSVNIKFPYQCYCVSYADGGPSGDLSDVGAFSIGNFVVNSGGPHLSNPTAVFPYTDYTNGNSPVKLIADSTYDVTVYHTIRNAVQQDAKVTLFIDLNNNHQYDIPQERVLTGFTNSANVFLNATVHIPADAVQNVLTGMRLIINNDMNPNVPSDEACGTYTSGETEDYVVRIRDKNATGIQTPGQLNDVFLYPNPTSGRVTLQLKSASDIRTLRINVTSISGQQILLREFSPSGREFSTELDLNDRAKGIYFVEISTDKEKVIKKLIVR